MAELQEAAYQDAARHLKKTEGQFHFLVYGENLKSGDVGPSQKKAFGLCRLPYFWEDKLPVLITKASAIIPSKDKTSFGLDGAAMAAYLRDLISFKNAGCPAGEAGGDTTTNTFDQAACLACIDDAGNLIAFPLDRVCEALLTPAQNLQAQGKKGKKLKK
jgi:hypothetical protein